MKHSLQEIWRRGCLGEALSDEDEAHFAGLARSRFHTFQMSLEHARTSKSTADFEEWAAMLERGLATELIEGPGLERYWLGTRWAEGVHGRRVQQCLLDRLRDN